MPALGVMCREPFEMDEPGEKLKSALLAASKLGYVNCRQLQVLLQSMTKAAKARCRNEHLMMPWTVMALGVFCANIGLGWKKRCGWNSRLRLELEGLEFGNYRINVMGTAVVDGHQGFREDVLS